MPRVGKSLDEVRLKLSFELGRLHLNVADVARLAPGMVLRLERPAAPAQVLVRVGGAVLGTGELVEVDGTLGVQLLTWTSS